MCPRVAGKAGAAEVNIRILPRAWADLADGVAFYDAQSDGMGEKFFDHLVRQIRQLARTSGIHPLWSVRYHRFVTDQRFPFAVFYRFDSETVFIHAVFDCRRDPDALQRRLDEPE